MARRSKNEPNTRLRRVANIQSQNSRRSYRKPKQSFIATTRSNNQLNGIRLLRRPVKKIVVTTKHPKQQVQAPVVKRDALRITLRPTECRIRKKYKKMMLKSIAAQIKRSGGNVSSWRKQRAKRRNIIYRC